MRRVGLESECFSWGCRLPSVFSLANIEQGDIYDSSFIRYTKLVPAKVSILPSTFHHNTLGPMQSSYHKFKEGRDLVTRRKPRTTNKATFSFNSHVGGDDLAGRSLLGLYMNMEHSVE